MVTRSIDRNIASPRGVFSRKQPARSPTAATKIRNSKSLVQHVGEFQWLACDIVSAEPFHMGAGIGSARHGEQQGEETPGEDKRRVSQDGDAPLKVAVHRAIQAINQNVLGIYLLYCKLNSLEGMPFSMVKIGQNPRGTKLRGLLICRSFEESAVGEL